MSEDDDKTGRHAPHVNHNPLRGGVVALPIGQLTPSVVEELPPAPEGVPTQFVAGDPRTREIAAAGGRARQKRRAELKRLTGLGVKADSMLFNDPQFKILAEDALEFVETEIARLAADIGGGSCPPPACACVAAAGRAMLWSAYYAEQGNAEASMRADASMKVHLIAAHDLCVREAEHRKKNKPRGGTQNLEERIANNRAGKEPSK